MNGGLVEVPISGLVVAALVVVVIAAAVQALTKREGVRTLWAAVRMTAQLVVVGFVLTWVFDNPNPAITVLLLAIMIGFGIFTVYGQHRGRMNARQRWVVAAALAVGPVLALAVFLVGIVQIPQFWDPRYVIPTAGMIIGNSMTGVNLALNGIQNGMRDRRSEVEQALYLGATPARATRDIRTDAFTSAVTPTTTSMLSMGIIFLPGMMTGQILSGVDPLIAVVYQAVIMVGILLSVVLTSAIILRWGMGGYFDAGARLIAPSDDQRS
ncbi:MULTISPECIES: ABC transporter permease [Actinomycetes]|jgi:putative ABC transport system permease protein|uniref:ABC transporter permease n=1 Tax=Schaalia naturae TaxID=635203 RepID=A0ABW2SPW6_9ACTO|nr:MULTISPECIES: iron export ABC transporter permease subunit FetB [Actinomycetes]MCA9113576.1 iron export ABC transporter permease subunit FetB [Planctomycetaceae bacterium]MEA4945908.1 iron export ABC transporter permease subunit FetB [Propionicimonas sp.]MEA5055369.1 iron export ABC transporter permease subunit FetB [Propionicimonas sp.]